MVHTSATWHNALAVGTSYISLGLDSGEQWSLLQRDTGEAINKITGSSNRVTAGTIRLLDATMGRLLHPAGSNSNARPGRTIVRLFLTNNPHHVNGSNKEGISSHRRRHLLLASSVPMDSTVVTNSINSITNNEGRTTTHTSNVATTITASVNITSNVQITTSSKDNRATISSI